MVVRLSRRVSYICTFVFNWFHLVLHISLGIGSGRWWNGERESSFWLLLHSEHLTSSHLYSQHAIYLIFFLVCFHLTISNLMNAQCRAIHTLDFMSYARSFKNIPPHSFPPIESFVRSASAVASLSFTSFFLPSLQLFIFFALPLVFAHCSLGLFITVACMKRRKHEKWRKKTWNRLNSEIKPATSMCMCTPMKGNGMVHNYQRKIILLLYYTTSAFRKSRYIRPRAYITLQFHLIFRA